MLEKNSRIILFIYIGICIAALIAYEPIRHNDFVSYDDSLYITENPDVKAPITFQSLARAFTKPHFHMWHPLTTIIHMLDCQLYKLNPLGHHFTSLLLHIASALLLFKILSDVSKTIWSSAFVAALFALHPVQVESVAWAAELKTVSSGMFWLLTIAAYVRYTKQPRVGRYILLLLIYGLCIMTKPAVVTLPFALLLLDYWPLGRLNWKRLIIEKIPLFAMSAFLSLITFTIQQGGGKIMPLEKMPLGYRIANMFISYMRYIGKTIWPSRLAVFYPPAPPDSPHTAAAVCVVFFILITVLCIYIGRRKRYLMTGWLWYAGVLVPMIGLVQSGSQAMANRYMYLPIIGLLTIIAWTTKDFIANQPRRKIVAAILSAVILLLLTILTRMQVKHWQNSLTLFEYALQTTKNNSIAENSYGCALFEVNRFDEAELHFRNAVRIDPTSADNRNNLGKTFFKQRKLNEAIACFNDIINRGQASEDTYYYLAMALNMQKKHNDAVKYLAKVINMNPKYPAIHKQMGYALLAEGKADEAVKSFEESLRINPNEADVYSSLGTAYNQLGKYKPAVQNWTRAVELEPNKTSALNNLAWMLAAAPDSSIRDPGKAIELAQQACKLTNYKEAAILDTLAVAFASAGRFDEAITTAQKAVDIAKANEQKNLIGEIQNRIELYKQGRRYIQK